MTVMLGPTRAYEPRDELVTLGHASVEWVMGRYFTPDTGSLYLSLTPKFKT